MHSYETHLRWDGSTSDGIRSYSRDHVAVAPPAPDVQLSADPAFLGNSERVNPEQLVVMAASSCQMLSFLGAAARANVDIRGYRDVATAELLTTAEPPRLSTISLAVTVTAPEGTDPARIQDLAEQAHRRCYIANSLAVPVQVTTTVVTA